MAEKPTSATDEPVAPESPAKKVAKVSVKRTAKRKTKKVAGQSNKTGTVNKAKTASAKKKTKRTTKKKKAKAPVSVPAESDENQRVLPLPQKKEAEEPSTLTDQKSMPTTTGDAPPSTPADDDPSAAKSSPPPAKKKPRRVRKAAVKKKQSPSPVNDSDGKEEHRRASTEKSAPTESARKQSEPSVAFKKLPLEKPSAASPRQSYDAGDFVRPKRDDRSGPTRKAKRSHVAQPFGVGLTSMEAGNRAETSKDPLAKPTQSSPEPEPATTREAEEKPTTDERARFVLKPKPTRRSRGGRKHKRSASKPVDSDAENKQVEEQESNKRPTETAEPAATEKSGEQSPAKRSRSKKKKRGQTRHQAEQKTEAAEGKNIEVIDESSPGTPPPSDGREMIINITGNSECRIAVRHQNRLEELYMERQSSASHVGNIYLGKITNVEPSIQAAFVDFGLNRNGFLHVSDVQPKYFPNNKGESEQVGKKVPRRERPLIQKCFRRGDNVIVQVTKEGVGTKGPTLTTYLSIPGRFVVMMPGMNSLGVSRRIEDENDRRSMRELLGQLTLPEGIGFILRTAGLNRTKRELQNDLNYLNRLWKTVEERIASQAAPCELYQESDLVIRTIRDVYSSDFTRIVADNHETAQKAREFLRIAMPRITSTVAEYKRHEPIFHYFNIEEEIKQLHSRQVPLPSGGSIVIDTTEAMVAIDVNSGKFRDIHDAEEAAFRVNIEAAAEIARQLRLRDLGGLVVCDFIDLRLDKNKRAVEKALRDALKNHKERARILRMSKFGLIEMTRQRQRPSIKQSIFVDCPHCSGSGLVKTPESMSLEVIRILQLLAHRGQVRNITVTVAPKVSSLVLNNSRAHLHKLETQCGKRISIVPDPTFAHDQISHECTDDRGMPLRIEL